MATNEHDKTQEQRKNMRILSHGVMWENLQYFVLFLLIVGQSTIGWAFFAGQGLFLIANLISFARGVVLDRPTADRVKDAACGGVTVALILIKLFS